MTAHPPPVSAVEKIYALIALLLMVGAFTPFFGWTDESGYGLSFRQGSIKYQLASGSVYLISIILLMPHGQVITKIISRNFILFSFIALALLSSVWAEAPQVSFRRSIALFGTTCLSLYLVVRFPRDEFLKLLALAFMIVAVESTFLSLFVPSIGVHSYQDGFVGAWRGALGFKNDFGRVMVLGAIIFWALSKRVDNSRFLYLGFFVLSTLLVIKSQSRSAWVVLFCVALLIPTLGFVQKGGRDFIVRILVIITACATIAMLFLLPSLEQVLELIDRDITLTGRTYIWTNAIDIGIERPWLGHGYRSFWNENVTGFLIFAGHGHNSFLDLWLELGFVGLGLFVTTLVIGLYQAIVLLKQSKDRESILSILFLVFLLLYGTVAKTFPEHGSIEWVIYVATLVFLSSRSGIQSRSIPFPVRSG